MERKAVSGTMLTVLLIGVLMFNISLLQLVRVEAEETVWWFDYATMSVCWRADLAREHFFVDFDGDHSTAALSGWGTLRSEYGRCSDLGVVKILHFDGTTWRFGWAFTIGELKIDQRDAHIHETMFQDYTEWFYFWVPKTTPPTDWVVCLQMSDGVNPIPVRNTFWYSEDRGATWNSFTPVIVQATIDIEPETLNLKSNGDWMSCYIELPSGYDVNTINIASVMLNGTIPVATGGPVAVGDYDIDGIPDLMVKFNRGTVVDFINTLDFSSETGKFKEVTLLITGEVSGVPFRGSDTVKIVI